jgi:phosphohistidine phosphatase
MKTLILMRHAKSAWDDPHQKDIDRPLSVRGRKTAPRMGGWLELEKYRPDVVLCSSARRTRDTLELLKPSLPANAAFEYVQALYMAAPREMLTELAKVPTKARTAMLLGHNPGMASLAVLLAGAGGDEQALANMHSKFPTAAIAVLAFDAKEWSGVVPGSGKLLAFMRPRDLP